MDRSQVIAALDRSHTHGLGQNRFLAARHYGQLYGGLTQESANVVGTPLRRSWLRKSLSLSLSCPAGCSGNIDLSDSVRPVRYSGSFHARMTSALVMIYSLWFLLEIDNNLLHRIVYCVHGSGLQNQSWIILFFSHFGNQATNRPI